MSAKVLEWWGFPFTEADLTPINALTRLDPPVGACRRPSRHSHHYKTDGGDKAVKISLEQAMAVQTWIADGVTRAAEGLAERHAFDTDLEILETRCCALADYGAEGRSVTADEEVIAGVLLSFQGPLCGASLLAMDPHDALAWSQAGGESGDPIGTFLELGGDVLGSVIESAAEALEIRTEVGRPTLEETSLTGCLLRTHAPSDTVLTSCRLRIMAGRQAYDATLHLLMDPKRMFAMLGALAVAAH